MLLIYETHRVHGTRFYEFEEVYRDEWLPAIADNGVRLLWYFNHAHGTSVSFNVVTATALRDWASWEQHAARVRSGSLQALARRLDSLRYGVEARLLEPLPWSPLQSFEPGELPASAAAEHPLQMYVEDTIRPDSAGLETNIGAIETAYPAGQRLAMLTGAFRCVPGGGSRRDIVLLQQVLDLDRLADFYTSGTHDGGPPWSAHHGSVPFTDTWTTRMLRTAAWSPLN